LPFIPYFTHTHTHTHAHYTHSHTHEHMCAHTHTHTKTHPYTFTHTHTPSTHRTLSLACSLSTVISPLLFSATFFCISYVHFFPPFLSIFRFISLPFSSCRFFRLPYFPFSHHFFLPRHAHTITLPLPFCLYFSLCICPSLSLHLSFSLCVCQSACLSRCRMHLLTILRICALVSAFSERGNTQIHPV
jgi:hypothetical protein